MPYDAFISYNHAKDRWLAAALQWHIQRLGKPWYKSRVLSVFRDDTSLSATPRLQVTIEQSLSESRFLILLACPEAARSPWVTKEVAYWLDHKSVNTLLIALTDSELSWDPKGGDFVWSVSTPLPSVVKGRLLAEPKWVDLRAFRNRKDLRRRNSRAFLNYVADLAAAVQGIPKEDLLLEELQQEKWKLKLAWSVVVLLLMLAAAAAWEWKGWSDCRRAVDDQRSPTTQMARGENAPLSMFMP
jgi:hypothetical protein